MTKHVRIRASPAPQAKSTKPSAIPSSGASNAKVRFGEYAGSRVDLRAKRIDLISELLELRRRLGAVEAEVANLRRSRAAGHARVEPAVAPSIRALRDRLDLDQQSMAAVLGCSLRSLSNYESKSQAPERLRPRLREVQHLIDELAPMVEEEDLREWFRSPVPDLGGRTPVRVIADGDLPWLLNLVRDLARGELS